LNEEFVIISLYVDDRMLIPKNDQFDFQFPNGRIKKIRKVGEKWAAFQNLNFASASQPFYVLITAYGSLLNSPIQFTSHLNYKNWLIEGLKTFKSKK